MTMPTPAYHPEFLSIPAMLLSDCYHRWLCFLETGTPNDKLTGVRALSHVRLSDLLGKMRLLMGAITIHEPQDIVPRQALPVLQQLFIPLHVLQIFDAFIRSMIDDNDYDSNNWSIFVYRRASYNSLWSLGDGSYLQPFSVFLKLIVPTTSYIEPNLKF